jgi:hypothetical protein
MPAVLFPRRKKNLYLFLVCTLESGQGVDRIRALARLHYWFYVAWLEEKKRLDLWSESHTTCGCYSEALEIVLIHENH